MSGKLIQTSVSKHFGNPLTGKVCASVSVARGIPEQLKDGGHGSD